jgi:predicted Zn-dependent protease
MKRRSFFALGGACALCGCAGAVHQLPQISDNHLSLAQSEVQGAGGPPPRRVLTDQQVDEIMHAALDGIRPPADQMCREMSVGVCDWRFMASANRSMNAGAGANGLIFINRGVVEYAANEEEVCLVFAHEIGHQAANHIVTSQRNRTTGALIGAILLGAAGAAASYRSPYVGQATRSAMDTGANIGGAIGRISFSKEQEREADYLAAVILYRSNVDLDKARGMLVTLARASGRRDTGMLDSHPAGPDRIASWDRAVAEIRASQGALPARA